MRDSTFHLGYENGDFYLEFEVSMEGEGEGDRIALV